MKKITQMRFTKLILIALCLASGLNTRAQQDPMYSQYMFNMQAINPAYVGSWQTLGFTALARQQWVGLDGAPQTYSFSMQLPFENERFAAGLNLISDKVGMEKRFYLFGDYSYFVKLAERTNLRLGLKAGFTNYTNDLNQYTTSSSGEPDPLFIGVINEKFMPNFGIGAYLDGTNYFVSLSVPKVINNDFKSNYENYSVQSEIRHYFLSAGMIFAIDENLKFKPTMLTKASFSSEFGTPLQFDLSANFLFKEKFWLGGTYRFEESFGMIAQFIFNKKLRLGYAYDISTNNLRNYNNGSHELMVSYQVNLSNKINVVSPRYF